MPQRFLRCLICALAVLAPITLAFASGTHERTQFNRDLRIEEGEGVGEVTCINCSIFVRGEVSGDATAIHGHIVLEPGGSVSGDATTVLGDIRLASGTRISGDATAVAGDVLREPDASVGGDVTALAGGGWILLIVLIPLFVLGGIIALIAWLIQRNHRTAPLPVRP